MRIAILMMQKNERLLLPIFLRYHESLLGSSSIYLFDNGSSDKSVINEINAAEARGVHVDRDHDRPESFVNKGEIFTQLIHRLDDSDGYDFYFPLDCDEFIACETPAGPSCSRLDIERSLTPFLDSPATLWINHKYWANPLLRNRYKIDNSSRKCFFARHACGSLDHGFHHGRARNGTEDVATPIVYFEFHYKPYWAHQQACRYKLLAFYSNHSRRALRDYIARQWHNHHCAYDLLQSKLTYLSQFTPESFAVVNQSLLASFAQLGADDRSLFERTPARGLHLWLRWLKVRARLNDIWLTLQEGVEIQILALPHVWRGLRRRLRGD